MERSDRNVHETFILGTTRALEVFLSKHVELDESIVSGLASIVTNHYHKTATSNDHFGFRLSTEKSGKKYHIPAVLRMMQNTRTPPIILCFLPPVVQATLSAALHALLPDVSTTKFVTDYLPFFDTDLQDMYDLWLHGTVKEGEKLDFMNYITVTTDGNWFPVTDEQGEPLLVGPEPSSRERAPATQSDSPSSDHTLLVDDIIPNDRLVTPPRHPYTTGSLMNHYPNMRLACVILPPGKAETVHVWS